MFHMDIRIGRTGACFRPPSSGPSSHAPDGFAGARSVPFDGDGQTEHILQTHMYSDGSLVALYSLK